MATILNAKDIALRATSPRVASNTPTPSDVTGVTYTVEQFGARLTWNPVSDPNAIYVVRIGGTDWATALELVQQASNSYLLGLTSTGDVTVRIKAFNRASNLFSTNASSTIVTIPLAPAPTITYVIVGVNEKLSWTFPSTFNFSLDHFEIRYGGTSWATATFLAATKSTFIERKVDYAGTKKYWVAGIDSAGNEGTATAFDAVVIGPGATTNARADVVDNNALLYWTAPTTGTLPIDRYEIRKGVSFAGGVIIGSNADSTFTTIFEQAAGTFTYWIGTFDSAGNSNTPISIVATINQPPDFILRQNFISTFANQTLSGSTVTATIVNMSPNGGGLLGPVNTTETWATHFTGHSWSTPADQVSAGYPLYAEPSTTTGSYSEVYDLGVILAASVITANINTTTVAGSITVACQINYKTAIGDSWTAAGAGLTSILALNFRYAQVVWTITCTAGANLLQINALNTTLANKLRTDSGAIVVSNASTGVTIPFNIAFVDADTPLCQANGVGTDGKQLTPVVSFSDVPNPTGFTVWFYNYSTGAKETGTGSWTARGY